MLLAAQAVSRMDKSGDWIARITDPMVRAGMTSAVNLNLVPAATERVYPGHFCINADGGSYGSDTTWPGIERIRHENPRSKLDK